MGSLGRSGVTAAAALFLAVVWWEWRVAPPSADLWISSFDSYVYYEPTYAFAFGELRAGRLPLWSPYQHLGAPFFATAQHGLLYPLSLPYLLLPTLAAMHASAILHLALAFVGMTVLMRALGGSAAAAFTGAVAFAFSIRMAGLLNCPHHLYAAAWMPIAAWLALRVADRPEQLRWGLLLGGAVGCQYLGGYPQFVLYTLYLVLALATWRLASAWRRGAGGLRGAHLVAGTVSIVVAAGVAAPQLLPAYELAQRATRGSTALTAKEIDPYHAIRGSAATPLLQSVVAAEASRWPPALVAAGPVGLVLLLVALFDRRHRGAVAFFASVLLVAMLLALGQHTPLFTAYLALPGSTLFRVPDRFAVLATLGLAVVVGFGIDALARRTGATAVACLAVAVVLLLGAALAPPAAIQWLDGLGAGDRHRTQLSGQLRALGWWMAGMGGLLGMAWGTAPHGLAPMRALVPLLLFVSLGLLIEPGLHLPETRDDAHRMTAPLAEYLRAHQGFDRTLLAEGGPALTRAPARSGLLERIYVVGDRENVYPRRLAELFARLSNPDVDLRAMVGRTLAASDFPRLPQGETLASLRGPERRLLDLLGVRFVVDGPKGPFVPPGATSPYPAVGVVGGMRVFRNPDAMPRAFLVYAAEVLPADGVLDRLASPDFDFRRVAILETPPTLPLSTLPSGATGNAVIVAYEPHTVEVLVTTAANALLVLTDQWYPGWIATLDGREVPLQIADYVFRGVSVPPGVHRVRFRYEPTAFRAGVGVFVAVAVLLLVALAMPGFRRRL